ncbi:MAG TPA: polysaccharide deacetylase family protein [Jiangellales bacterium]|nr:polysaccharide deacetylase family protein [Jiangellales bacterium]
MNATEPLVVRPAPQPELTHRAVPLVLMYHAVADVSEDPNQLAVTPDRFEEQMWWLRRLGLRGVSVAELLDAQRARRHRGLVGITFDDGYTGVLHYALPVLRQYGFGATVFIVSERLGGTNEWDVGPVWRLLDGTGVDELARAGVEIGSHSANHRRLAGLPPDQLDEEVRSSRDRIKALLGSVPRGFAYPYGSMDATARSAVADAGYGYACAVDTPRSSLGLMALPRMYVGQRDNALRLFAKRLLYRSHVTRRGVVS